MYVRTYKRIFKNWKKQLYKDTESVLIYHSDDGKTSCFEKNTFKVRNAKMEWM